MCNAGRAPNLRSPSPPSEELDDALIQEYLSELEEMERREAQQSGMVASTGAIDVDASDPSNSERAFAQGRFPHIHLGQCLFVTGSVLQKIVLSLQYARRTCSAISKCRLLHVPHLALRSEAWMFSQDSY